MAATSRIATVLAAALAILVHGGSASGAGSFRVTSTLDGKTVLPRHIRWLAFPKLPAGQVTRVDFLIDGKPHWSESEGPYVYGGDEHGKHEAYLVTTWLKPGNHRFTVKATASDGQTSADTVNARVLPALQPPKALAGVWFRRIPNTSGAPLAGTAGNPTDTFTPPGTYKMVIEPRWIRHYQPGQFDQAVSDKTGQGWVTETDYAAGPTSLTVYGNPARFPFNDAIADGGGSWCWEDGPVAVYSWSVSGDTLTLAPKGRDACGIRSFIWAGTWVRGR